MPWTFYDNLGEIKSVGATGPQGDKGEDGIDGINGVDGQDGQTSAMAYIWSSRRDVITGAVSPFIHAIAANTIDHVFMDMPDVDAPGGTIQIDVKKNGTSIFTVAANPTMSSADTDGAGGYRSADFVPDATSVVAGDQLQVIVDNSGVATETGRLKVYIVMS